MSAVFPANHQRHKIKSEFTTSLLEGYIICGHTEFLFICFLISIDLFVVVAFCFKPFHFSMLFSVDSTIYFFYHCRYLFISSFPLFVCLVLGCADVVALHSTRFCPPLHNRRRPGKLLLMCLPKIIDTLTPSYFFRVNFNTFVS